MKIHKTKQCDRGVYKYTTTVRGSDGKYVDKVIVIKPGEDGVTEANIKKLHSLDDSEVYYNLKNLRPERTDEEKEEIENWKKKYISDFKERHSYEPNESMVKDAVKEAFPRNYNLSLDYDDDGELDADKGLLALITSTTDVEEFHWSERMGKVLDLLTDKQRLVIKLMFIEEYSQSEIANSLNISSVAVKKHLDKAKAVIEKNY